MYADTPSWLKPISDIGYALGLGGYGISRPAGGAYDPAATTAAIYSQPNTGLSDAASIFSSPVPNIGPAQPVNIDPNTPGLSTFTGGNGGGGGGAAPSAPSGGGGTPGIDFNAIIARQRQAADSLFNRARGLYDQGISALGEKRKQFQDVFNQGQSDILQGFEKGSGELQASAAGARERNANALRALGLGGSAVVRTQGKERQNEMKQLAGLQDIRGTNERQNKAALDENNMWANTQEAGLGNYLRNAQDARSAAENTIVDNVAGMFNNIINNQMAYNASLGQKTVSPYQVDIPSMVSALSGVLSSAGLLSGSQTDQNVNIPQDQAYLDFLKRRAGGVAGQGLYA